MTYDSLQVGRLELVAILDADAELEGSIADSFPGVPADDLPAFRDWATGVLGADHGGWRLRVRAWLIRHPGGVVLVDTGIGLTGTPAPKWMGVPGSLHEVLAETGTPHEAIDTVVITHVHDDHIGGTVLIPSGNGDGPRPVPAFPRARYVIQRADWDWQHELARTEDEDAEIARLLLDPLHDAGLVDLVEGDVDLVPGIQLHHAPGHTPGHQIVRLASEGRRAIISADTFNHPAQLPHPEWPSGPDAIPELAAATRRAVIAELAAHPGTPVAPTHLVEPFGEVRTGDDGLAAWVPRD